MADTFEVEKQPVYARDESPSKLFGFTWGEMLLLAASLLVPLWVTNNGKLALMFAGLAFLYVRQLKSRLPDNIVRNALRYYMRRSRLYRAGGRDYLWRTPLVRKKTTLIDKLRK